MMCVFRFVVAGFNVTVMEGFSKLIAETVGTAFLMFGGCMGGLSWHDEKPADFVGAASFGLVVMIIIQCYGHISGAHLVNRIFSAFLLLLLNSRNCVIN